MSNCLLFVDLTFSSVGGLRFWFSTMCDLVAVSVGSRQVGGCVENLVLHLHFMKVPPSVYTRPVSLCSLA